MGKSRGVRRGGKGKSYLKRLPVAGPNKEVLARYHQASAGLKVEGFTDRSSTMPTDMKGIIEEYYRDTIRPWVGSVRGQGVSQVHEAKLDGHPRKQVWLCFTGNTYWFKRVDTVFGKVEFSGTFYSREVAMNFFYQDAIVYLHQRSPPL